MSCSDFHVIDAKTRVCHKCGEELVYVTQAERTALLEVARAAKELITGLDNDRRCNCEVVLDGEPYLRKTLAELPKGLLDD